MADIVYSTLVPEAYEMHGTQSEDIGLYGAIKQQVTLRCNWANRYTLVNDIVGAGRLWPQPGGAPTIANRAAIKPVPGAYVKVGQGMEYEEAEVSFFFDFGTTGSQETAPDGTKYSDSFEPTIGVMQVKYENLRWGQVDGDWVDEKEALAIQWGQFKFVRTLYNVPSVDPSCLTLLQTCNNAPFTSTLLGLTFPIETLQFIPPVISRSILNDGSTKGFILKVGYAYQQNGWNKWYHAPSGTWLKQVLYPTGQDYKPFRPADYSKWLF